MTAIKIIPASRNVVTIGGDQLYIVRDALALMRPTCDDEWRNVWLLALQVDAAIAKEEGRA